MDKTIRNAEHAEDVAGTYIAMRRAGLLSFQEDIIAHSITDNVNTLKRVVKEVCENTSFCGWGIKPRQEHLIKHWWCNTYEPFGDEMEIVSMTPHPSAWEAWNIPVDVRM
jgi:hypothetical protein